MTWVEFKIHLSEILNLSQDALHIYAAVLIQLVAAALLRRSLSSPLPWFVVLAILVANETVDLAEPGRPIEQWQVIGGLRDLWNTMAIPTLLWLLARFVPSLLTGRRPLLAPDQPPAGR